MKRLAWVATLVTLASPLSAQTGTSVSKAAATITAANVVRHVGIIADDSMKGRYTPSRGLELTAQYVADQFKKLRLKPAGDTGTWFQRYPLPGSSKAAPNTVGILEGSDPQLKNEYIVFSAHMDHAGTGVEFIDGDVADDTIYNGANDNASGVAGIIELAAAFSRPDARPKRSLIFLAVSGKEMRKHDRKIQWPPNKEADESEAGQRYWGSSYFVAHPPVPLQQVVADINLDKIGRRLSYGTAVTGVAYTDLGAALEQVGIAHPEPQLKISPEERMTSDHVILARNGVPILSFGGGSGTGKDELGDSPETIDAEFEVAILRTVFYLGQEVANADRRPRWNPASYQKLTGHD